VEGATGAYSRNDFAAKLSIAYKEARETRYWLRLATGYLTDKMADSMLNDCEELVKILSSILKTTSENSYVAKEDEADYLTHNS